ncbi:hypothetical protein MUO74_11605 [Candidatus Bathyarchaeota archaeon]|nr:hypothetical protein [Candidatus Bathyarchaeota archaeon]
MKEIRVLGLSKLRYGFPMEALERGMNENPHVIAADGGSTDLWPFPLGWKAPLVIDRKTSLRDFRIELQADRERKIPYIVGSMGSQGITNSWSILPEGLKNWPGEKRPENSLKIP